LVIFLVAVVLMETGMAIVLLRMVVLGPVVVATQLLRLGVRVVRVYMVVRVVEVIIILMVMVAVVVEQEETVETPPLVAMVTLAQDYRQHWTV
jgi:hypothetical protein